MNGRMVKAGTHKLFIEWAERTWKEYVGEAEHSEGFEYWKDMIENPEDGLKDILMTIKYGSEFEALE